MNYSRLRQVIFIIIALCIPLTLLVVVEFTLRLTGVGNSYPLFINAPQPGYMMPNPELVKRYVHHGADAPNVSPDTYYFRHTKSDSTLRLVVMGGSTAAGFPYGRFGSPAGLIQQRVQAAYPDRHIEVISVAMSSINSYTLRDIADEVAEIKPDAVLIYAGHNEYLGIMGAGATDGGHLANLAFLALKDSRLFQLAQRLLAPQTKRTTAANNAGGRTVMATLAKDRAIALGSETYTTGMRQFHDNMQHLLTTFRHRDIPVLLSTLAANEQDQPPFKSAPTPGFDVSEQRTDAQLAQAITRFPEAASAHFAYAQRLVATNAEQAHQHYTQAMDLDLLRFRAPSEFNQLIKQFSKADGVYLVDSLVALRRDSATRSLGFAHMLEHLHPNERGYFVIANAFYEALEDTGILPVSPYRLASGEAWKQRPLTDIDSQLASLKIAALTSDYPFTKSPQSFSLPTPSSQSEAMAINRYNGESWLSQQPRLIEFYQRQKQWRNAATVANTLATALPFEASAARAASQLSLRAGRLAEAVYFSKRTTALLPDNINAHLTLAEALYKFNRKTEAITTLQQAQARFPDDKRPQFYLNKLEQQ